jgi:alpha-beta hydrolase superfamily lysophospholipase
MYLKLLHSTRRILQLVVSSLIGAVVVLIIFGVISLNSRPDLSVWHKLELDEEFRADAGINSFEEYLALEDRLFEQLDQSIYLETAHEDHSNINRYHRGSLSDPGRWPTNWNRSFVLKNDKPSLRVLLLHGMSDSPYSVRSFGQSLHKRGATVIGLRIPGHGQAPSGLLDVEWEDMAAAVRLAIKELNNAASDEPLFILGYSNGGALAVQYALDSLSDDKLPAVDGLVLMSPEIGLAKIAALAVWQERLGHLLGLEQLAWNSLQPEYDPWKYGSFALNAGKQAYRITQEIQRQITRQAKAGLLDRMPPILAFQSAVDATVEAPDLINNLFKRLPLIGSSVDDTWQNGHELVLFDINRQSEVEVLIKTDPASWVQPLLDSSDLTFQITFLSNKGRADEQIMTGTRLPKSAHTKECGTGLLWPPEFYSLSHVALPFPPDDPTYGDDEKDPSPGINLSAMALRGERNVLLVSAADMLRLRINPFHSYMMWRLQIFMGLQSAPVNSCL